MHTSLVYFTIESVESGMTGNNNPKKEGLQMPKDKKVQTKSTLRSMQEVTYQREFKKADRAGGYTDSGRK